jgi:hypothetical protein
MAWPNRIGQREWTAHIQNDKIDAYDMTLLGDEVVECDGC